MGIQTIWKTQESVKSHGFLYIFYFYFFTTIKSTWLASNYKSLGKLSFIFFIFKWIANGIHTHIPEKNKLQKETNISDSLKINYLFWKWDEKKGSHMQNFSFVFWFSRICSATSKKLIYWIDCKLIWIKAFAFHFASSARWSTAFSDSKQNNFAMAFRIIFFASFFNFLFYCRSFPFILLRLKNFRA